MRKFVHKFKIWFRVGSYKYSQMCLVSKANGWYEPPKWWRTLMCKLGRHDHDLDYMGPGAFCATCECGDQLKG